MAKNNGSNHRKDAAGKGKAQSFSLAAPGEKNVQLVGEFTHWREEPIIMQRAANGVWQAAVQLTPGEHRYRFLVGGEWRDDPDCSTCVPNPFGTRDAVRHVS